MDKRLIAERFARARTTYSREAHVQQQVAEKEIALLRHTLPDAHFDRIAELIGIGFEYAALDLDGYRTGSMNRA